MYKFIRKLIVFLIVPALFMILVLLSLNVFVKTNYKVKSGITNVFLGDSHIQLAINDSLILESLNCGATSETFYFSYYKLKNLLNDNPSIKNVYLGFSFHNLSGYSDRFVTGDYSASIAPKYYFILPLKEQFRLIYWNRNDLFSFVRDVIKTGVSQTFKVKHYPFMGGYSREFNKTFAADSSMNKRINFQYFDNGKLNSVSRFNINYLYKIISFCKRSRINLVLINTPLHRYYYDKIPRVYKEELNKIVVKNRLKFIDLSKLKFEDNCFIPDGDHVSTIGADKVSEKINEIVK